MHAGGKAEQADHSDCETDGSIKIKQLGKKSEDVEASIMVLNVSKWKWCEMDQLAGTIRNGR